MQLQALPAGSKIERPAHLRGVGRQLPETFMAALVGSIIRDLGTDLAPEPVLSGDSNAQVLALVSAQIDSLPLRIRWKLNLALAVFRLFVFLTCGRLFQSLTFSEQSRVVRSLSYGPIQQYRQVFRALRALTLFAYFEQPEVSALFAQRQRWTAPASFRR